MSLSSSLAALLLTALPFHATLLPEPPPGRTAWSLGDDVRYVVPEGQWLLVTDLGRSAGLTVRAGLQSDILFLSAGDDMGTCIARSPFGVPCPPGSTVYANANQGVRGYLASAEPIERGGPEPKDVLAKHALINPEHRSSAHVATVPAGSRLHLSAVTGRKGSAIKLLVDGEVIARAYDESGSCRALQHTCEPGQTVELATDLTEGVALGAVFGYFEPLP